MKKNKINPHIPQPDSKSDEPIEGKDRENPYKKNWFPVLFKPEKNIPVKADLDNRRSIKNRPHLH